MFAFSVLIFSSQVFAHKLNVFAFVEGNKINVEGYFSDGILAKHAKVSVTDQTGNLLQLGQADAKGLYQFEASNPADMLIKIDAGLGHIASYEMKRGEVAAKPRTLSSDSTMISSNADVEQAVANAIKPLAREISELKNKTRMSDIVGGIGIIVGLLGLYAYLKYRKESNQS